MTRRILDGEVVIGEKMMPSISCPLIPSSTNRSAAGSPSVWSISTVIPRRFADRLIAAASSAKYGEAISGTASAMKSDRPLRSDRADTFGRYPSSAIACSTLVRVASVMCG
jgi:hypothetical protein